MRQYGRDFEEANPVTRFLVVVFDALRPEFVTPQLMPNLHAFAEHGVRYSDSHAVFPTETRVNQTAVVTGCMPARTGIMANNFVASDVFDDRALNTGKDEELEAAFEHAGLGLIEAPSLGQRLTAAGLGYASLSAGTPGGGRLINHSALKDGSFRFAMRRPAAAVPGDAHDRIAARIGPMPEYQRPATAWISWAVDAYLNWVEVEMAPDVMLLWLCEPDETFHYKGIGSDDALTTIKHVDREFGRILAAHESEIDAGGMQVVAMSDHGQITLQGEPVGLVETLQDAGFRASNQPAADVDCVVLVHNGGGIWVRDHDPDITVALLNFLMQQDWCGPVFTRSGLGGTLSIDDVGLGHLRGPTIALALRTNDDSNDFAHAGLTRHDAPYPVGGGCHGGLSRYELNNFHCFGGKQFKSGVAIDLPVGNVDITPTICALLGLDGADQCDGRVLREALRTERSSQEGEAVERTLVATNPSGPRTHLSYREFEGVRYLNRAWVD
ncbi:MAG: alkaline phosphatase family protein [Hyphomicrobiaceae bacterium]